MRGVGSHVIAHAPSIKETKLTDKIVICSRGYLIDAGSITSPSHYEEFDGRIVHIECLHNHTHKGKFRFINHVYGVNPKDIPVASNRDPIDIPYWGLRLLKERGLTIHDIDDWEFLNGYTLVAYAHPSKILNPQKWEIEGGVTVDKTDISNDFLEHSDG